MKIDTYLKVKILAGILTILVCVYAYFVISHPVLLGVTIIIFLTYLLARAVYESLVDYFENRSL